MHHLEIRLVEAQGNGARLAITDLTTVYPNHPDDLAEATGNERLIGIV